MLNLIKEEIFSQKADIETSSENYAKRFSGKIGEYFLSVQSEIILKLLKKWQNAKVLDVGGGHAQLAVPLIGNGFNVTIAGSDETCRERLDKFLSSSSFQFYTGNLLKLPFDYKSFDIVTSIRLLTHEENWKLQISELCRVAKYAVIVDYPDIRSFNILYDLLFGMKQKFEKNTRTYKNFSRKEIIEEFRKNNFGNITIKPEFFLPMVVHRAIKNVPLLKSTEKLFSILGLTKLFGSPVILRAETNTN
jgi:ubiquinone/menaquinone biosynthesis C-methylase UbiE